MEPQAGRRISPFGVTKRSNYFLRKTTRRSHVHVQTIGLNAETKKCRHRANGEICLLTFPFIGHLRFPYTKITVPAALCHPFILGYPMYLACTSVGRFQCIWRFSRLGESTTYAPSTPLLVRSPPPLPIQSVNHQLVSASDYCVWVWCVVRSRSTTGSWLQARVRSASNWSC